MSGNDIDGISGDRNIAAIINTLKERIARLTEGKALAATAIPELFLFRREATSGPETVMYEPSIAILAQGAKRVYTGEGSFVYDSHHFLAASVDFPTIIEVISASREKPCLGIVIGIARREVSQLILEHDLPEPEEKKPGPGISTGRNTPQLLSAVERLMVLLDEPRDIPVMGPIIRKEILYRLLISDQGNRLRQIATSGSRSHQISRAIDWLKENFARPLKVDDLAARVNMSTSTFHHHFRALTSKSPLQFQKWLRLNEARRLMLVEHLDASNAGFKVGYESPSHFSREYSRLFGNSPRRDIIDLRSKAGSTSD